MKERSRPKIGIFVKLSCSFILVGLVPLLLFSTFFLKKFSGSVNRVALNSSKMVLDTARGSIDALLRAWDGSTTGIYTKSGEGGRYLGELLVDESLSAAQKDLYVRRLLAGLDTMTGLRSIRFLAADGTLYSVSEQTGKVVNAQTMEAWRTDEMKNRDQSHKMMVEAAHRDDYYTNINDTVITVKRNLFDVSNAKSVDNLLGTIYFDVSKDIIAQQLVGLELMEKSGFYIIDQSGAEIYKSANQPALPEKAMRDMLSRAEQVTEDVAAYYLCQPNQSGGWISAVRIDKSDVLSDFQNTQRYILIILGVSCVALLLLYFLFSRSITTPFRRLKEGMEEIQKGNLKTRVHIDTGDEVGALADGLNQMAEQLGDYIDRVYGAEIKQREAELKALKSQIKPHYLYNTLDLIRMTALDNDDPKAAKMVESLARQLRYITDQETDVVPLGRELANVEDYFKIVRIRFENRIDLKISVPEELCQCEMIKLALQPLVENAVKHGLRPKEGRGTVWVSARRSGDNLEVTILDDGVGMDEHTLERLNEHGVGIHNVRERLAKRYGEGYGVDVESMTGMGCMVVLRVPYRGEAISGENNSY